MFRRLILLSLAAILGIVYAIWQIAYFGVHPKLIFSPPPAEPALLAVLDETTSFYFPDLPLVEAIDQIERKHGVEIDIRDLTNSGRLTGKERIYAWSLNGVSLRSSLRLLMRPYLGDEVVVEQQGDGILIADARKWRNTLTNYTTKVYPLTELLAGGEQFTEQQLVDAILSMGLFEDSGYPGVINAVPGGMFVLQTPDVHRQIQRLIDGLSQLDERPDPWAPIILDDSSLENRAAILAELDKPTQIAFAHKTRQEICAELQKKHGIPIVFNPRNHEDWILSNELFRYEYSALSDEKVRVYSEDDHKSIISTSWKNTTLRSALELVCDDDYFLAIRDGVVLIGPKNEENDDVNLRVYPLPGQNGLGDGDKWIDIIKNRVPGSDHLDPFGDGWSVTYACGMLFLNQSDPVHRRAEEFFRQYDRFLQPWSNRRGLVSLERSPSPREQRIEQVLQSPMKSIPREPVELLRQIVKQHDVNVWVSPSAAQHVPARLLKGYDATSDPFGAGDAESDDPFGPSERFAKPKQLWHSSLPEQDDGVSLDIALRKTLEPHGLTYDVDHDSLVIITLDEVADASHKRIYPIARFINHDPILRTADELVELIQKTTDHNNWGHNFTRKGVEVAGDLLVVVHTRQRHLQIQTLLDQLKHQFAHPEQTDPITVELHPGNLNAKLDKLLDQQCEVTIQNQTLRSFAEWLESEHRIPVEFDAENLPADYAKTLPDISTRATLRIGINKALAEFGLIGVVSDGSLWITPFEWVNGKLPLRIYGVADIVDAAGEQNEEDLVRMIDGCLGGMHWEHEAKYGFAIPLPGMLVVGHTYETHEVIERCLAALRRILIEKKSSDLLAPQDLIDARLDQDDRIAEAFKRPAGVTFDRVPLETAVQVISTKHNLPISLILENEDYFNIYDKITSEMSKWPLGDVLQHITAGKLFWLSIQDGTVFITDRKMLRPFPFLRFYDVSDLIEEASLDVHLTRRLQAPFADMFPKEESFETFIDEKEIGHDPEFHKRDEQLFEVLAGCLFRRQPIQASFGSSLGGKYSLIGNALVVSGSPEVRQDVEWMLQQLRNKPAPPPTNYQTPTSEITIEFPASGGFGSAKPAKPPPMIVKVYDVQPLLNRFDAVQLTDMIRSIVAPSTWQRPLNPAGVPNRIIWTNQGGSAAIEPHRHKVVIRQHFDAHDEVDLLLQLLDRRSNELPNLDKTTGKEIVKLFSGTDDELLQRYCLWTLARLPERTQVAADFVVAQLSLAEPELNESHFLLLLQAAAIYGPLAEKAIPIVEAAIDSDRQPKQQRALLRTLAQLGPRGMNAFNNRLATTGFNLIEFLDVLDEIGEDAKETTGTVVMLFLNTSSDRATSDRILHLLPIMDPDTNRTRAAITKHLLDIEEVTDFVLEGDPTWINIKQALRRLRNANVGR